MKLDKFILTLVAFVIGIALYDHATKATASVEPTPIVATSAEPVKGGRIAQWGINELWVFLGGNAEGKKAWQDLFAFSTRIVQNTMKEVHNAEFVAAPAPASAYTEVINELQGEVDSLKKANDELFSRVVALEARKECTCPKVVAAPVAPVKAPAATVTYRQECQNGVCRLVPMTHVQQPQAVYQGDCSDGSCGTRRGLFGRRR